MSKLNRIIIKDRLRKANVKSLKLLINSKLSNILPNNPDLVYQPVHGPEPVEDIMHDLFHTQAFNIRLYKDTPQGPTVMNYTVTRFQYMDDVLEPDRIVHGNWVITAGARREVRLDLELTTDAVAFDQMDFNVNNDDVFFVGTEDVAIITRPLKLCNWGFSANGLNFENRVEIDVSFIANG